VATDAGDLVFGMAANNQLDSGPGGVTRDRAVDLARQLQAQGLAPADAAARAAVEAEAETLRGTNPRNPQQTGVPQSPPSSTTTAPTAAGTPAPAGGGFMAWLGATQKPMALVSGIPNGVLVAGVLAVLMRR
jgi:hypothetical protein